jgi:NADPH-dependent 2,4-dienoyl-CoA reductase/sulfur reductase-like enzyme
MARRSAAFEVVVIGAGPAGIAAACSAAESGRSVALLDDAPRAGGSIWRGRSRTQAPRAARRWLDRLDLTETNQYTKTSGIFDINHGPLLAETPRGPLEIAWGRLILAVGARELFLPFPGWTLPGVVGAGGLQLLAKAGWPVEGRRVVVAGSGPLLPAVAAGLRSYGAEVRLIAEQTPWERVARFARGLIRHPGKLAQAIGLRAKLGRVPYRFGVWPLRAEGDDRLQRVVLTDGSQTWDEPCDLLACGFGLVPNVELPLLLGCALEDGFVRVDERQETSVPNIFCAGELTGIGGADAALVEGQIAGLCAAGRDDIAQRLFPRRASWHRFRQALREAFAPRPELARLADDDTIVCRCEDVSLGRMKDHTTWRDAKLMTRCGMGPCQGRVCGAAARVLFGWGMESVRPPVLPVRLETLIEHEPEGEPACDGTA